jgi:hypothetical protein
MAGTGGASAPAPQRRLRCQQDEAETGAGRRHEHVGARSLDAWMAEHRPGWRIEVKPSAEGGKITAGVRQGHRVERKPRAARRATTGIGRSSTAASLQEQRHRCLP